MRVSERLRFSLAFRLRARSLGARKSGSCVLFSFSSSEDDVRSLGRFPVSVGLDLVSLAAAALLFGAPGGDSLDSVFDVDGCASSVGTPPWSCAGLGKIGRKLLPVIGVAAIVNARKVFIFCNGICSMSPVIGWKAKFAGNTNVVVCVPGLIVGLISSTMPESLASECSASRTVCSPFVSSSHIW